MTNCKKISIDFHGVISAAPEFFAKLMQIWHQQGVKIYVVSGGPRQYIEQYLAQKNIHFDVLWCIFDYFDKREKIAVAADGSFHIDDEQWNTAKARYCAGEHIGLHIDDSKIYGHHFSTPYVRFIAATKSFLQNETILSENESPQAVAEILGAILNYK